MLASTEPVFIYLYPIAQAWQLEMKMNKEGYELLITEEDVLDDSSAQPAQIQDADPLEDKENLASSFATFWNICNTIQGLPILVIPYAVRNGGFLAVLALLLVAAASNYTGKTIVRCLYETDSESGERKRVRSSYAGCQGFEV